MRDEDRLAFNAGCSPKMWERSRESRFQFSRGIAKTAAIAYEIEFKISKCTNCEVSQKALSCKVQRRKRGAETRDSEAGAGSLARLSGE